MRAVAVVPILETHRGKEEPDRTDCNRTVGLDASSIAQRLLVQYPMAKGL
jgi:hypothetical protein